MPILGYGVYQVDPAECERCVRDAIEVGYRSIDTARLYANEQGVGKAIAGCGVARDELFITTKVWITSGYDETKQQIAEALTKLGTDYVDLMLIHQPFGDLYGSYRALQDALKAGQARAIGVSNFYPDRLTDFCHFADVIPAVNQIETHVFQQQVQAREVMAKYGVQPESWGPLAEGKNGFFENPLLEIIGAKYGKSVAQTALRFLMQSGIVVIPKSVHKERMAENFDLFDFALTSEDMAAIRELDTGQSLMSDHRDPVGVERLIGLSR
jgi:diketogulonate reductase-like aldo/keto reductase